MLNCIAGGILKQKDTLFSETPLLSTWYILGLRFYFVRRPQEGTGEQMPPEALHLFSDVTHKAFFPSEAILESILTKPEEETMLAMVRDVNEWLNNHTGNSFIEMINTYGFQSFNRSFQYNC